MSSIKDVMSDTSFVEEFASYLREHHDIQVWVVDDSGAPVPLAGPTVGAPFHVRHYPFAFEPDIGGLRCAAEDEAILKRAEPHILLGIHGINQLLLREIELQQTGDEMLTLSGQLSFLFRVSQKTIGINELGEFCKIVLEEIAPAIEADYGIVHTKGKRGQRLDIFHRVSRTDLPKLRRHGFQAQLSGNSTVISRLSDGTSVLRVPIKEKNGPIGYLAFFRHPFKRFFTAYEKKFVTIIEHIISPTVETMRLYGSLQELYVNTVKALAAAIDAKDRYTHGHSYRVARYSTAIGRQLEMTDTMLNDLEIAAYMHDLGKIGVPESILGKPGKLTDAEFQEIKKHPVLTNKILEPIHLSPIIVDAAVQHHERLDGRGYPYGLKGEEISLFARIIAVADVFDALTSERPYRDSMPVEKALRLLCDGINVEFDRNVVQAIVSALRDGEIGKEWSRTNQQMKFVDVDHLNQFLIELSKHLLERGGIEAPRSSPLKESGVGI